MGALTREDARVALASAADVVAWDERFVALLDELARAEDVRAKVHVKLDTGMGRLGAKTPRTTHARSRARSRRPNGSSWPA